MKPEKRRILFDNDFESFRDYDDRLEVGDSISEDRPEEDYS